MKKFLIAVIPALILLAPAALSALDVPALKGYVNDYADMISPEAESRIESDLKAFEQSDSTQVVILTVPSLDGDALEDYTIRVAEKWKIGQAKKDNGVIFFASKNDRVMRIEVGRGLEGVLTDLLSGRILDNIVRPKFKSGDFDGGFADGAAAIVKACRGEFTNDSLPARERDRSGAVSGFMPLAFFVFYLFSAFMRNFSKLLRGLIGGLALPAMVHFILFPLGLGGAVGMGILGFFLAVILPYMRGGGGMGGGGWSSGSGGGSSGGGFSGGGGSFGGGGSSGGW